MTLKAKELAVSYEICDFSNTSHCHALASLINEYISDPMGGGQTLLPRQQLYLVDGLANHPSSLIIFAVYQEEIVGLAVCFINFSTFKVKSYLYIHDFIVKKNHRGLGIGRKLLGKCISIAKERDYCKVTLEVRDDNTTAQKLYQSLDFKDTEPPMLFWTKTLLP